MEIVNHLHSVLRWFILVIAILNILFALKGMLSKSTFGKTNNLLAILLVAGAHLQLVTGLIQYFLGAKGLKNIQNQGMATIMKDSVGRFFAVEHIMVMIIAVVFIQIGRIKSKKAINDTSKHKISFWFYLIALLLILSRIPWPFMAGFEGTNWF